MSTLIENISKWEKNFSDFKQNLNELSEETKGDEYFKVVDKKYAIQVKERIITPLIAIFDNMSEDQYNTMLPAIEDNFGRVEEYRIPEDWMFKKYPFLFE